MKKILLTTMASSALLLTACSSSSEVASTKAGKIREDDLYEAMKSEPLQNGMTVGETVLQGLLIEDIFAHLYGDKVSDEVVDAELEEAAEEYGGLEDYTLVLESQGIDIEAFRDNIRMTLLIREAVKDNIEITDEALEEKYEEIKPDATVQHILVDPEDEELAKEIIVKLEDGADFAELVAEHSIDPGSLEDEGVYSFYKGETVEPFEEAAFALEEGELASEPVETEYGFHVIHRLELDFETMDELGDDLEVIYIDSYLQDPEFMNNLISQLAKDANVRITDEELTGAMAQYMTSQEEETEEAEEIEEPVEDEE